MSENRKTTNIKKMKKSKNKNHDVVHNQKENCVDKDTNGNVTVGSVTGSADRKPLHSSMELLQVAAKNNRTPVASRKAAGSNWKAQLEVNSGNQIKETEDKSADEDGTKKENMYEVVVSKAARLRQKRKSEQFNKFVAMDCEMVGVGLNGKENMLARVSVVNKRGDVLLDKYVKGRETVTDYRTSVSGIRPHDIDNGEDFKQVKEEVLQLIQGHIGLVGHAIRNDLAVLHIKHPFVNIRDTARYKPLFGLVANGRTPSLKHLSLAILGLKIQTGERNSVEDALAAMKIYNRLSSDWEKYLRDHQH